MSEHSQTAIDTAVREVTWQIARDCGGFGRAAPQMTSQVIRLAVELWPPLIPLDRPLCGLDAHSAARKIIVGRIRDEYSRRYGMGVLAMFGLSLVVNMVVKAILRRWWSEPSWRKQVRAAQYGYRNPA